MRLFVLVILVQLDATQWYAMPPILLSYLYSSLATFRLDQVLFERHSHVEAARASASYYPNVLLMLIVSLPKALALAAWERIRLPAVESCVDVSVKLAASLSLQY